jgi:hypothetical protein
LNHENRRHANDLQRTSGGNPDGTGRDLNLAYERMNNVIPRKKPTAENDAGLVPKRRAVLAGVTLEILSQYFNIVADTDVDFSRATSPKPKTTAVV